MKHRVFIVEDHPLVREGYASLVARTGDLEVCGEAASAQEAIAQIPAARPDAVVVDISLQGGPDGIELVKHLQARHPDLRILVVSGMDESLYAERALRAGARGYIMKQEATRAITGAIRAVLSGEIYLSEQMQQKLLERRVHHRKLNARPLIERLTDREMEAFYHIGQGMSTRQIAEAMIVSTKTIDTYRRNIKEKLGLSSTEEMVQQAGEKRAGLTARINAPSAASSRHFRPLLA